jgi:hypothetical protein
MKKLTLIAAVTLSLGGCAVVGGIATEVVGSSLGTMAGSLFEKKMEIKADNPAVTFESPRWKTYNRITSFGFTVVANQPCRSVTFEGKAYSNGMVVGTFDSFRTQSLLVNMTAGSKAFVDGMVTVMGNAAISNLVVEKIECLK